MVPGGRDGLRAALAVAVRAVSVGQLALAAVTTSPFIANKASSLGRMVGLSHACLWQRETRGGTGDAASRPPADVSRPPADVSWSAFVWVLDGSGAGGEPWVALLSTSIGLTTALGAATIFAKSRTVVALVSAAALSYYGPNVTGLAVDCLTRPLSVGIAGAALATGTTWLALLAAAIIRLPRTEFMFPVSAPFEEGARPPDFVVRRAHGWLDLIVAHVIAVGTSWGYRSLNECRTGAVVVVVITVAHLVYVVGVQPQLQRTEWAVSIVLVAANTLFAVVCCAAAFASELNADIVNQHVSQAATVVVALFYAQLAFGVAQALRKFYLSKVEPSSSSSSVPLTWSNEESLLHHPAIPRNPLST